MARLDAFIEQAAMIGSYDSYKVFPAGTQRIVEEVRLESGESSVRAFLRAVIAHRLLRTLGSPEFALLPARVSAQQLAQFARIVADGDEASEWLSLDHDLFHKEFGIVSLRLYVAGAQLVDPRCGIPRSLLVRGHPLQWLGTAAKILALGGFRPYFQIHTHKFMLDTFNEEGWNECYRCCAELYVLHPAVRGMYGSSWFYDPALTSISPRLEYLRAIPQASGAHIIYVATGGDAQNNSLSTSPTRKKLFEQGKYLPKSYMMVWGRADQQKWAESAPASSTVAV